MLRGIQRHKLPQYVNMEDSIQLLKEDYTMQSNAKKSYQNYLT